MNTRAVGQKIEVTSLRSGWFLPRGRSKSILSQQCTLNRSNFGASVRRLLEGGVRGNDPGGSGSRRNEGWYPCLPAKNRHLVASQANCSALSGHSLKTDTWRLCLRFEPTLYCRWIVIDELTNAHVGKHTREGRPPPLHRGVWRVAGQWPKHLENLAR